MKTKPLSTPKSSTTSHPQVTRGFVSAHIPCCLRNSQQKISRFRLRNAHRNILQRWSVHLEALAAPIESGKVNENLVGANWEIINETSAKGDAWICQRPKPRWLRTSQWKLSHCWIWNHQRNWFHMWHVDSPAPTGLLDSEIVNQNWVTVDSKIITETPPKGDARGFRTARNPCWLRKSQWKPSRCRLKKSSTKHLPQVTPRFVRAHIPFWVRNSHQKLSRCRLKNHHRNHFHRWRVGSSALTTHVDSEKVNKN